MSSLTVIKKPTSPAYGKTYVVGQRSWIAQHLFKELERRGKNPEFLHKAEVGDENLRGSVMYLIAGCARPTQKDIDREEDLCERAQRTGAKLVYLSSSAVDRWEAHSQVLSREGELYVLGKRRCEAIVTGGPSGCGYALRAPVVFGPGQRLESPMLMMEIINRIRDSLPIVVQEPFTPFQMVYVQDLVRGLIEIGDTSGSFPVISLRTEPAITPVDLCALAAPGHPVLLKAGWAPYVADKRDKDEMYHIPRVTVPFRREDVISTVAWYDDEVPQLGITPDSLLLEAHATETTSQDRGPTQADPEG